MTSEPSKRRTTAESSTKTGERPTAMPSEDLQKRIHELHELLEMAARAAEIGVWNYDLERGTTNWNEQLYRLLGLPPREGTEDPERFFEFVHPEDRTGKITALQAILTNSDDEIDEEFRILRADGNIRWLAARGRLYRDESGRVVRISGIYYDITERNQAEETERLVQIQMATQLSDTERVNEELSQLVYAVTHDLKGSLRALRHYADFLFEDLADALTGEQKTYLVGMKKAVEQGDALINSLLNFSRIGRVPLEREAADVPDVVNEIRAVLDPPPDVEIAVESNWPDFFVDRTLLKQILQNLVANGIKFNQHTPKRIEIGWQPAPNDRIEIFVRDNGIGIASQYWDQIFRIFQRLHTHRDYDGTGIGLAIVQKAAQKLNGSVRLESEPGNGSTFYVELPREMAT
jgi:PAS domain S-box-containing protein